MIFAELPAKRLCVFSQFRSLHLDYLSFSTGIRNEPCDLAIAVEEIINSKKIIIKIIMKMLFLK